MNEGRTVFAQLLDFRPAKKRIVTLSNLIFRPHTETSFTLRDMADSRRFVMTYCYDSPIFEA